MWNWNGIIEEELENFVILPISHNIVTLSTFEGYNS